MLTASLRRAEVLGLGEKKKATTKGDHNIEQPKSCHARNLGSMCLLSLLSSHHCSPHTGSCYCTAATEK